MQHQDIFHRRNNIVDLIKQRRLAEAITATLLFCDEVAAWAVRDRAQQLRTTYGYLLSYLSQGAKDNERGKVVKELTHELYTLVDLCAITALDIDSPEVFHARRRELAHTELATLIERYREALRKTQLLESANAQERDKNAVVMTLQEQERLETDIFNKIWSTFPTGAGDAQILRNALSDSGTPYHTQCLIVMALFLGLMKYFDATKLRLIIEAYSMNGRAEVQLRALIALLLVMKCHRHRIPLAKEVQPAIELMTDISSFADDINTVQLLLTRTRNTENVTRKVQNDIMPNLTHVSPELMQKIRRKGNIIDWSDLEENPEWQELLEKNGVTSKMEQLTEMQQAGDDVFISTFARLKSFAFFKTLSNWFLPFHTGHSSIISSFDDKELPFVKLITRTPYMCNSDRFSFSFSLSQMPSAQRQVMLGQVQEHAEQMQEMEAEQQASADQRKQRAYIANRCVQDLYRFFKLFSRRHEFLPAMDGDMDFTNLPYLAEFVTHADTLNVIAEFYLKYGFNADAEKYFTRVVSDAPQAQPILFQKLGFACERQGKYAEAIQHYEHYLLACDTNAWCIKHLALCHRALGQYEKAIDCYRRIENMSPGSLSNTLNLGHCLMEAGHTDEAMQQYFKADLMDDSKHRARRPLAWCAFVAGNDNRSLDYYNRILAEDEPNWLDYLNRGHVLLCMGQLQEAIASYRLAYEKNNRDVQSFRNTLNDDKNYLAARGADLSLLPLIADAVTSQS